MPYYSLDSQHSISLSPKAEKFIEEFKRNPENLEWLEKKVKKFDKWRTLFGAKNIDQLSQEQFQSFLGFKENQSWDGIHRHPKVYADMDRLRRTIKYLVNEVDETTPEEMQKRLDAILEPGAEYEIAGLKRAIVTPILHICDTRNRFGVWNSKVDRAFEKLGLLTLKPLGSPGRRYLIYNNVLTSIGEKYDLNLKQVDMLMHKIATEYKPGIRETVHSPFAFTTKDFESCTGKKDDAKYLSKRFKILLEALRPELGDKFTSFSSYVAKPNIQPKRGQKKAEYRDHMWLGFAHPKFDRAQKGIQFQATIGYNEFSLSIWIDRRAPKARKTAAENAKNQKEGLRKLFDSLAGYGVELREGYEFKEKTTALNAKAFDQFITNISKANTYVEISKTLSKEEALSMGTKIVEVIVNSLDELYPIYKLLVGEQSLPSRIKKLASIEEIILYIKSEGFFYPEETIINYHTSLETKPFVILSGITGIGKTKLTELYANGLYGIDQKNEHYKRIPVQPNWNNKKPLLGYYNPIMEKYYIPPFLNFLLKALKDCQDCGLNDNGKCTDKSKCVNKYFVCLDEMNLAHVEYYLADLLSTMESDRTLDLHSTKVITEDGTEIGPRIVIPENFHIIGTVNIDETTKEFSPKVLDRANTVYLDFIDLDRWLELQRKMGRSIDKEAFAVIKEIHDLLRKNEKHFGYRVCSEMLEYIEKSVLPKERALDLQIIQKILPKLGGDDNVDLRASLQALKRYLEKTPYESSKKKTKKMLHKLEQQGFTSFFD